MDGRFSMPFAAALLLALGVVLGTGCSAQKKLSRLEASPAAATLTPVREEAPVLPPESGKARRDTITVEGPDGKRLILMRAIRDENGEMVANDVLDAAVVTARFRHVAERHGKVDLAFQIIVPERMRDSHWQLRFQPQLLVLEDSLDLDPVVITGRDFRKAQLRGYQQYERFLASIISDSLRFVRTGQLEHFLRRNLPQVYRFRNDTSFVSDECFASAFGVTQAEARAHYTRTLLLRRNERKIARKDLMFKRYVKSPILSEGLRLDTVMLTDDGQFAYHYVQTILTRPRLKKAVIRCSGGIFDTEDRQIYRIPQSDPLTFYISSVSSFADGRERYIKRVLERRVTANATCRIGFRAGQSEVDASLGNNSLEISHIREHLQALVENREFDLDSILVTASCSPEGGYAYNTRLSRRRSEAVARFFEGFIRHRQDFLRREAGMHLGLGISAAEHTSPAPPIRFLSRQHAENWEMLDALVGRDSCLSEADKLCYHRLREVEDPDRRESLLRKEGFYTHFRENLYPLLRIVRFDFHLHRKGMVKDTVHTTEPDTVYRAGVQAIRDRDYRRAVALLRPYHDYNLAVACCALDLNESALEILEQEKECDRVDYMLALIYARKGEDAKAVQHYLKAVALNPSFVHRGNLDPEISELVKRYNLKK